MESKKALFVISTKFDNSMRFMHPRVVSICDKYHLFVIVFITGVGEGTGLQVS